MDGLIPQETVAELLGVEVRTLRQWRTSDFEGTRKYLPAVRETATSKSYYEPAELRKFLERNEEYRDRVLAAFAPEGAQDVLLPQATATQVASRLRGIGSLLLGGGASALGHTPAALTAAGLGAGYGTKTGQRLLIGTLPAQRALVDALRRTTPAMSRRMMAPQSLWDRML